MRMIHRLGLYGMAVFALVACGDDDPTPPADERFDIALTGAAEKPNPVTTTASGSAIVILLSPDSIQYSINVAADSVIAAHFHAGDENSAGPVMIFIFGGPVIGRVDGPLVPTTVITRQSTFVGVFTFDSLMTRIKAGTTYMNVHTRKNTGGELRGQVKH
jgi:hypothetical protein